jgi:hypothetical protein
MLDQVLAVPRLVESFLENIFVSGDGEFYWDARWSTFTPGLPVATIAHADGLASLCALTSAGLVYCQGHDAIPHLGRPWRVMGW